MATIGKNQVFEIKNGDGTSFHNLVLRKSAVESIVMSLGDKISGDVYYKDNTLSVTMHEYITYNGVNYMLINPPTIVREGVVSDNSELRGMTKYSFVFYHPMCQLSNFPFTDVAVTSDESRYLSESKVFSWIGKPADFVAKMNKNLVGTEWIVEVSSRFPQDKLDELSDVIPFDNATIADACKTFYDVWGVPYVVDKVASTEASYAAGKRFKLVMGLPSNEIYENASAEQQNTPYVFQMGHGVGLKNNSRTSRNNKIITRISGFGSENNIPYGYPQVRWYGTAGQSFTYGDHAGVYTDVTIGGVHFDKVVSYPIYKGILNGEYVELIKHPFTRTHLMPSIYRTTLFNKISFFDDLGDINTDYDPDITLVDFYDAVYSSQYPYPNTINLQAPSYESHEFEDEKPELGEAHIISATPLNNDLTPASSWDDSLDDEGNYKQSYFQMVLPQLSFDLYACASITEEMQINMRSGACLGCTFTVQVDWDDYKRNFYDEEGNFAPNGSQRDLTKYPKSNQGSISLVLQKDNSTFGTLMPNMYQYPKGETSTGASDGDTFVILGISLPESYILAAELRLDADMKSYMLENNVHYFDYPLKFDEDFLFHNENILSQIRPNTVVRFNYAGQTQALFVKQITIKYGDQPLPQYDITLTDNVEVVLNQIGQVAEDVEKLSSLIAILRQSYGKNVWNELAKKLSKTQDDTAAGFITMLKGLQVGANFVPDILGEGGVLRMRDDGKVELVTDILYARMRAYFDSVVIREYRHESGNRIKSPAQGFNASRVENIKVVEGIETIVDDASEADFFRCYWRVDDGEKKAENQFIVGDLAFCEHTEVVDGTLETKRYWRVVTGRNAGNTTTEDGEAWIDLSNAHDANGNPVMTTISWEGQGGTTQTLSVKSFESSANSYPEAHDDICMLGCTTDTTRQGAIIEYVSGVDAPTYQIYQGLGSDATNPYSLSGKNQIGFGYNTSTGRAYMNVYGDFRFGARPNTQGSYLEYNSQTGTLNIKAHVEFTNSDSELDTLVQNHQKTYDNAIAALIRETEDLQAQIDGAIESYFMEGEPSLTTPPVMNTEETHYEEAWLTGEETQEERIAILNKHIGDLYYDKETGHGYRFLYDDDTSAYVWTILTDEDVTEALRLASEAQETADGKSTTFLNNTSDQDESKRYPTNYKKGDTWILQVDATINGVEYKAGDILTASTDSETYSAAHWSKQVRYTDDTKADSILNNTYYQQLTGGTISQNITNAANAASAAQSAANNAQSTANAAQTSATAANNKLNTWADDGVISPTEKLALKNQKADVEKEYAQIIVDAAKYTGVSTTAFTTAYNRAITAFNYYTADSTEDITIITDEDEDTDATPRYSRISAYYAARQTVLNDFATAAKKYATDMAAAAAEAFKSDAVYRALKSALGSKTDIVGGLVLTSLIGMRQNTGTEQSPIYKTWGGISGEYDALAKGGGIAAWYGGDMFDREDVDDSSSSSSEEEEEPRYATSLFRFDGSGYLASGNITWDEQGRVSIKDVTTIISNNNTDVLNELITFNNAFHFNLSQGTSTVLSIEPQAAFTNLYIRNTTNPNAPYHVATENWVDDHYVSKTFFRQLFRAFKPNETAGQADVEVQPNTIDATISNIKAMVGFWTEQYVSALGNSSDGGGGGASVLYGLNDVSKNATGDGVLGAADGYVLTYNGTTNHWYAAPTAETYVLPQATANALGGIKIGYSGTGKNYPIVLDNDGKAYVNVPWTDTTYDLSGYATQTWVGNNYLPLSGGTLTNAGNILNISSTNANSWIYFKTTIDNTLANRASVGYYAGLAFVANEATYARIGVNNSGTPMYWDNNVGGSGHEFTLIHSGNIGIQSVNYATSAGSAASATKLAASKNLWGNAFDGSANIAGSITLDVGNHILIGSRNTSQSFAGYISAGAGYGISAGRYGVKIVCCDQANAQSGLGQDLAIYSSWYNSYNMCVVGGNSSSDYGYISFVTHKVDSTTYRYIGGFRDNAGAVEFHTEGNISTKTSDGSYIQIGGARIVWDNTNKALKVIQSDNSTAANFYATGAISALGQGVDGGGGGQGDVSWSALASNNDTRPIAISHLTTALSNYLQKGNIDDSYITSTVSWGALAGDSYTPLMQLRSPRLPNTYTSNDYGCLYICAQADGQIFSGGTGVYMQIDGYFYQKGGEYRVLDTSDASGLSVNYANSAGSVAWANVSGRPTNISSFTNDSGYITSSGTCAAADLLKPNRTTSGTSYSASSWSNPSSFSNYTIVWGEAFANSSVASSDSGDILFALRSRVYSNGGAQELCIAIDGDYYAGGGIYKVLHEGNSSVSKSGETLTVKINGTSYSLTNTNTTYSASTGLSLSGTAFSVSYAPKVLGSYTSNGGQQNPNYFGTNRVGFLMMNTTVNSNSQYKDWIIMDCYSGNDVGGGVAIGVNRQSLGAYIMRSAAARTSWAESAELLGTHNSSVSLSGSTLTVKIAGVEKSLTNTTYSASTGLSLSDTAFSINSTYQTYISHGESAYNSLGNYLPLTGGTIQDGSGSYPFNINSTSSTGTWMYFRTSGTNKTSIGYWNNISFVANEAASGKPRIGVTDAGNPEFWVNSTSNKYAIHTSRDGAKFGGSIEIFSDGSGWNEGVRMHLSSNNWCGVVMCGSDNTGSSGTSAKTWSIHNNDGNFYIARNGSNFNNSSLAMGVTTSNPSVWQFNGSIYATGGVTALSDIRHKTIVSDTRLQVSDIARMRAVRYIWNDGREDKGMHVGSIAQDWQQILPEVVLRANDDEGTLSLQYGVAALISSITIARKVVDHEKEIAQLKNRVKALEDENEMLKTKLIA